MRRAAGLAAGAAGAGWAIALKERAAPRAISERKLADGMYFLNEWVIKAGLHGSARGPDVGASLVTRPSAIRLTSYSEGGRQSRPDAPRVAAAHFFAP